jgi:hypothetical protein
VATTSARANPNGNGRLTDESDRSDELDRIMELLQVEEAHAAQLLAVRARREEESAATHAALQTLGNDVSQHLMYLQTMWHDSLRESQLMSDAAIASLQTTVGLLTEAVAALEAEVRQMKDRAGRTARRH